LSKKKAKQIKELKLQLEWLTNRVDALEKLQIRWEVSRFRGEPILPIDLSKGPTC
jgi:hypothetical protein